ncbi:hypothetical protein FA13DRAFT_1714360 [Coprinellus micaceus]|uniref:Uncharacterized protein n=1 Tax=Coprinellus micaceus TaxID=71717 RepID=A0A4Y7SSQ5_COPMI|nr:hypothetical protein FA13DRAFT_1714360 [Coprinellus micaceus]
MTREIALQGGGGLHNNLPDVQSDLAILPLYLLIYPMRRSLTLWYEQPRDSVTQAIAYARAPCATHSRPHTIELPTDLYRRPNHQAGFWQGYTPATSERRLSHPPMVNSWWDNERSRGISAFDDPWAEIDIPLKRPCEIQTLLFVHDVTTCLAQIPHPRVSK